MPLEFVIYTDESDTKGAVYSHFYGGALARSSDLEESRRVLQECKDRLHLKNEIKWSKVTEQYLPKYFDLMNCFFDLVAGDKIKIRIMFLQNIHRPWQMDPYHVEHGFFLLYYQFLKRAFGLEFSNETGEPISLRIYLDQLPDTKEKTALFKSHLVALGKSPLFRNAGISIREDQIAEVDSHAHVILQCLDVVLGAIQFRLNKKHLDKAEGAVQRGRKTIAKEKLYELINERIRIIYPNFNIGISTGTNNDAKNRWRHPYRHWSFVPRVADA